MENNTLDNQQPKKKGNLVLWILGWIFFFPIPVMVLIWRKKNTWKLPIKIAVTVIFWILLFAIGGLGDKSNKTESQPETTITKTSASFESSTTVETTEESKEEYDSQFKNNFVALVNEFDAEIFSDWDVNSANDGSNILTAGVLIENNEDVINSFFDKLKELINSSEECDSAMITVGDKAKGADSEALFIAAIDNGEITTTMESINYNSAHNIWIRNQFSAWDGSHIELTKLIKENLNDEDSYKHIETTYRDIKTQADVDEVNEALSSAGKTDTVQVGDLFIVTKFSAKNGFNATIKSTAYGIASYENNSIKLIAIE
ncbi:MAG: hypothetical protein K6A23_10180 [Butyrivibrio sp.]|nr:hypothetical protein [Butyrivibrio sp.]